MHLSLFNFPVAPLFLEIKSKPLSLAHTVLHGSGTPYPAFSFSCARVLQTGSVAAGYCGRHLIQYDWKWL